MQKVLEPLAGETRLFWKQTALGQEEAGRPSRAVSHTVSGSDFRIDVNF